MKLFILQKRYSDICNSVKNLQSHISNLYKNNFIDYNERNIVLSNLLEISKNINSKYNEFINVEVDSVDETESSDISGDDKDNVIYNNLDKLNEYFKNIPDSNILDIESKPLEEFTISINKLIEKYGYGKLFDTLNAYIGEIKVNLIDETDTLFLKDIHSLITVISIQQIDISDYNIDFGHKNYKFEIPNKFKNNDYLEMERYLFIKINKYIIRVGFLFNNDLVNINLKSSQINSPYLYNKKNEIVAYIEENNKEVNDKFLKQFLRYDYLGNIYCMTIKEYNEYYNNQYSEFIEIVNHTILNLMKEFLSKSTELKKMFNIIFLLLLGDEENNDIAGILLGLLKEKKNQTKSIYNLFYDNLGYYLQIKLKRSSVSIKNQIDKVKSISIEDVDYTKQLVTNKSIPANVKTLAMEKIEEMKSFNNEYFKQLTFVKHILNYPWSSAGEDMFFNNLKQNDIKALDYIKNVEDKLENSSYGHDEAKKSLLQIIGKWISNPNSQGTSFGLVGPPGVGKTLLAKSVSEALDIPFAQITLGGQNDGEILHGHGYTYSGSQPGMIIKKMAEMGKSRCILYFDELDKACSKHGQVNEITSILIHLTDPNMNNSFQDRFFQGVDFPLDKVIMMFSYNDSSLVDSILLDRIKEINVSPYTISDKIEIIKNFTLPELKKSIGFDDIDIKITNDMIEYIIENYTQEAGVRNIKRKIEEILLTLNLDKICKKGLFAKNRKSIALTEKIIKDILKLPISDITDIHLKPEIGIINGLYATTGGSGGIIPIQVFINASSATGDFELKLTGKQGDVMKESVNCSYTAATQYIMRNLDKYKNIKDINEHLNTNFKYGFHIHAPSTSTPKDGPSAGCAFTSAFISRLLNKKIKNDVAMTGEVELTGKITKIGGLNYKLIGAKRAGIKQIYIPLENKKDLDEIKVKYTKLIDKNFKVDTFEYIDEIIDKILV
jgi:endopeptidase La